MSVTEQQFLDTVKAAYPHKWSNKDYDPVTGDVVVFALDTRGECQQDHLSKLMLATHVWSNNNVVKDTNGLFASSPITITLPTAPPMPYFTIHNIGSPPPLYAAIDFGMEMKEEKLEKKAKCECGAHKVGSNKHSDWCDLKENFNVVP